MNKYNNYKNLIRDLFKHPFAKKPIPYWGVYYIPVELYNFLLYLDNWCIIWYEEITLVVENGTPFEEAWANFVKKYSERFSSIYIQGEASSGKTSLLECWSILCSYWCNGWNYNNYKYRMAANFFDDYDGQMGG